MKDKPAPATPELRATIAALRNLASGKITTPLPEAPASADAALLELCTMILEVDAKAEAIDREARRNFPRRMEDARFAAEMEKRDKARKEAISPMLRVSKIAAKTMPGVYAKALILRNRYGASPTLAKSLTEDLLACPGLRASLWPAERA